MKKKYIVAIIFGLIIFPISIYWFSKKHYPAFEIYFKIPNVESDLYPGAYVFFNSNAQLTSFFNMNKDTRIYGENCKDVKFDFDNYTYVIVYGAKIESMYYSYKTTFFNDPSPSYAKARRYGKKCVFIDYNKASKAEKGVYFYRLKRDTLLRGFDGL